MDWNLWRKWSAFIKSANGDVVWVLNCPWVGWGAVEGGAEIVDYLDNVDGDGERGLAVPWEYAGSQRLC